jgi:hypothetical protein
VRGGRVPTEAGTLRDPSRAVSRNELGRSRRVYGLPADLPHQATEVGRSEMWRPMTDRMNHDKAWVMGVLEPILLLLFIATIGVLLDLL